MNRFERLWELFDDDDETNLVAERRQYTMQDRIGLEKWDDVDFLYRFRLTKPTVARVLQLIEPSLRYSHERTRYIRPVTQLLITLRFYALGSMQVSIADFAGVSISSVCVILRKVTIALAQQRPHFIKMPRTSEEQLAASAKFYDFARFPRVIGAIDCTHIKIQSPGGNEAENFRNRKGWFSINTQVVCTADMKITNIVARWPGASHDQTIFNASNIKNQLEQREFGNYIIIGDSGYRNSQYLATPHLHPASATEQLYNESHIRTRNVIERTFGVWKRRFPVLSLGMRLRIETVQAIIVACAVLHNIAINEKVPEAPTGIDDFEELLAGTEMPTVRCDQQNIADKLRIYASLAFMAVVIVTGVPMWWKTTEVYRVNLPYTFIKELETAPIKISVNIGIFMFSRERSDLLVKELRSHFVNDGIWDINFVQLYNIKNVENTKTPFALENIILKEFIMQPGDFLFLEWPKLTEDIVITTDRSALMKTDISSVKIQQLLKLYILQTYRVQNIINDEKIYGIRNLPPQTHYDILISVLNPRPDVLDVNWNVRLAAEMYIAPYLENINRVSNYTLKTQWRYQAPFEFPLKQVRDDSIIGRHYAIDEESLPHIITSIEKNLGGGISDNPIIHIVVYIPPCDVSPLYIYTKGEQKISHNNITSFLSPKWGSIIIHNPSNHVCKLYNQKQRKISFKVKSNDVMQIVLFHLQKLLDIYIEVQLDEVEAIELQQLAPRTWEYESYVRRASISHIVTATQTLQSLIQLLDKISYIVINDEVGKAIINSYENIAQAKDYLKRNKLWKVSEFAQKAFISSEQAFFDASLLAQLYFPDEQKYAIYIPLFLPILVPVITSLAAIKKFYGKTKLEDNVKS